MFQPLIFQGVLGGLPPGLQGTQNDHHQVLTTYYRPSQEIIRPKEMGFHWELLGSGFPEGKLIGKFAPINIPKCFQVISICDRFHPRILEVT